MDNNIKEGKTCACCKRTNNTKACPICLCWIFCPECMMKEQHNGSFICQACHREVCLNFKQTDAKCWECHIGNLVGKLRHSVSESKKAEDKLNNTDIKFGVLKHDVAEEAINVALSVHQP